MFNKWVIGGIAFLIMFSVACVLWYQHDIAEYKKEAAETQQLLHKFETEDSDNQQDKTGIFEGPVEITTQSERKRTIIMTDDESAKDNELNTAQVQQTEKSVETEEIIDVPVSPFGFGPYPELPHGWPADTFPSSSANHELIKRVMIKLLAQGVNVIGAARDDNTGLIYPSIPGIVYIQWIETLQPDGTLLRHAGRISGDPRAVQIIRNEAYNKETFSELITEKIIPKEIQVFSHNDAGIDPYNFLELKEE